MKKDLVTKEEQKPKSSRETGFSFRRSSAEKPEFAKEKKLFQKRRFRRQYRIFRNGGLGRFDSFFNAVYIILCENGVENEKTRLKKEGEGAVREDHFLELHSPSLRIFSSVARAFRTVFAPLFSKNKSESRRQKSSLSLREILAPALTLVLAVLVVLSMYLTLRKPSVLCASIDGEVIGYVDSISMVERAIDQLEDNAKIILGKSFHFPHQVEYSFTRRAHEELTDKAKLSEVLYTYIKDSICTASGLYIDETLVAVCENEETVNACLEALVRDNIKGDDCGILNEVRVITQAYPTQSMISAERLTLLLEEMLIPLDEREKPPIVGEPIPTAEKDEAPRPEPSLLSDLQCARPAEKTVVSNQPQSVSNVKIDLYSAKTVQYKAVVPYETVYRESADHYTSMADVTTQGADGSAEVTAKVYYVDGKEARRDILSENVTREPVARVISIGTKILPEDLGITKFTEGRFIAPRIARVSYYWGVREDGMHYGWDIPSPKGANIYAAASGRVIVSKGPKGFFAESYDRAYTGYGYCVVILHDDGFSTLYAHCSDVCVTLGQEVKQGEKIAEIGNTGASEGNHVHWEVMINGVKKNPALYTYKGDATLYNR